MKYLCFIVLLYFVYNNQVMHAQWTQLKSLNNVEVTSLAVSGNSIFAGTNSAGIYLSTNNGSSWVQVNIGLYGSSINSIAINGNYIFTSVDNGGIFLSTNNGSNWEDLNSGFPNSWFQNIRTIALNGNNIFVNNYDHGVFLSTNNGSSWTNVIPSLNISSIAISGDNVFVSSFQYGILLSVDNGYSWVSVNNGLPKANSYVSFPSASEIATNGNSIYTCVRTDYGNRIFLSTDNGENWVSKNNGLDFIGEPTFATIGNNIFLGTTRGKVYLSTNNGSGWFLVNDGLSQNASVESLAIVGDIIFAGTSEGIWVRPLAETITAVGEILNYLPKGFSLYQNYPNPFNPSTTISYSIPKLSFITLKVYDILGKEVASLVNEEKAPGSYEVKFNASSLSSGIYFYKLQAGSFIDTKKFILLK